MKKRIIYIIFGLIGIGVGMGTLPPLWDLIGWADNHFLALRQLVLKNKFII